MVIKALPGILDACSKNGVRLLKLGNLTVEFGQSPSLEGHQANPLTASQQTPDYEHTESPAVSMPDAEVLKDMERAQLMIDDPLGFEQLIIDEHMLTTKE